MARVNDLIPDVRTHLKGAPERTVLRYIRRAVKQFCQDSRVWQLELGSKSVDPPDDTNARVVLAVPSTGDDDDYELPEQSTLNTLALVHFGDWDCPLDPKRYRYDVVTANLILRPGVIHQTADVYVEAILETARDATTIPDFLAEKWGEGIADYAIAEMMMMPDQDWSDPKLGGFFERKYQSRVSEAVIEKAREGTQNSIEVTPHEFV